MPLDNIRAAFELSKARKKEVGKKVGDQKTSKYQFYSENFKILCSSEESA